MGRMQRWGTIVWIGLSGLALSAQAAASVRVVATIFPLADIVRQIGREHVEVTTLLPPNASPHTFEPTPEQMREVAHARLVVRIGAGLDTWTEKLLAAGGERTVPVTVTDGIPLLGAAPEHAGGSSAHAGDPHVWLDPVLVRDHIVPMIVDALSRVEPTHRAAFEAAAAEFREALTRLDAEIQRTLASLPRRNYIAFHAAWRYFGRRYGLHELAVVEDFPGKEPSAREIAAVVERARAAPVRAVLVEPQLSPRVAEQIAREFGGATRLADPLGGPDLPGRDHYLDLMRYNLAAFTEAMQ